MTTSKMFPYDTLDREIINIAHTASEVRCYEYIIHCLITRDRSLYPLNTPKQIVEELLKQTRVNTLSHDQRAMIAKLIDAIIIRHDLYPAKHTDRWLSVKHAMPTWFNTLLEIVPSSGMLEIKQLISKYPANIITPQLVLNTILPNAATHTAASSMAHIDLAADIIRSKYRGCLHIDYDPDTLYLVVDTEAGILCVTRDATCAFNNAECYMRAHYPFEVLEDCEAIEVRRISDGEFLI